LKTTSCGNCSQKSFHDEIPSSELFALLGHFKTVMTDLSSNSEWTENGTAEQNIKAMLIIINRLCYHMSFCCLLVGTKADESLAEVCASASHGIQNQEIAKTVVSIFSILKTVLRVNTGWEETAKQLRRVGYCIRACDASKFIEPAKAVTMFPL